MSEKTIPIPGRLKNVAIGGHVTGSEDIDAGEGKTQKQVNDETNATLALHQSEISGLNSQNYVSVSSYSSLPATGSADTIYRVSSWDGNANSGEGAADVTKYTEYAWNGTTYIVVDVKTQIGEVFDISEYKAVGGTLAKFADLSAALDNGNNVPAGIRKGGMSVKFVQSSDNKYVQYRLTADEWSINTEDWAIAYEGVYVENPEFVYVMPDAEGKILWAIKTDGDIYYGAGCPQQVKDYIEEKIAELSLDEYEDIVAFLSDYIGSDTTLKVMIDGINDSISNLSNTKVDKEEGKSLIDAEYASTKSNIENPEFLDAKTDADDKILEATKKDGTKVIYTNFDVLGEMKVSGVSYKVIENPEYIAAWVDAEDKIIFGFKVDGKTYIGDADFLDDVESIKTFLANFNDKNIDWDALTSIIATENPEYIEAKTDSEGKILAGRTNDGAAFESVGFSTPKLSIDGYKVENIEDPEGRTEITTDAEGKIISYRDSDCVKHENVGLDVGVLHAKSFNLPQDTAKEVEEIADDAFNKIKKYNLPKYGYVNIVSETFYLTADERYSDIDGVYLIRDYPDTVENAAQLKTLDYYYIKSTLQYNGDGIYSKYNDGVSGHDVKLDFYAASKVTKINDIYYVTESLTEIVDPQTGDISYETNENSIEVTQITTVPPINAWSVNKKTEHYCVVSIDFGHYLSGTFYVGVKFQGSSTLYFRKKNLRFTFYKNNKYEKKNKIKIGEFVRVSGFNLKANATDLTLVKEPIMCRLLEAVWETTNNINDNYPWSKEHTDYTGATGMIKAFPIECNIGGEYYGCHFFGLKKDGKNYILNKDEDGMFEAGTKNTSTCWTGARPIDYEDELNDEEDWVIEDQTQSNYDALTAFFAFINERLYIGSDNNTYNSTQLTEVDGTMYVTSTLEGGVPVASSVSATLIPFSKKTMPERMSIEPWIKYLVCLQVFYIPDNTCRNLILYTGSDKKVFYPFYYDLDLSWTPRRYNIDIMIPKTQEHIDLDDWGSYAEDMSFWEHFKDEWWDEIINCYHILREKVLNIPYMRKVWIDISENIPQEVLTKETSKWGTSIVSFDTYLTTIASRLKWLDEEYYK